MASSRPGDSQKSSYSAQTCITVQRGSMRFICIATKVIETVDYHIQSCSLFNMYHGGRCNKIQHAQKLAQQKSDQSHSRLSLNYEGPVWRMVSVTVANNSFVSVILYG